MPGAETYLAWALARGRDGDAVGKMDLEPEPWARDHLLCYLTASTLSFSEPRLPYL